MRDGFGGCTRTFEGLARQLGGFGCEDITSPVVELRSPIELTNPTLAVVEILMIALAVAALVHSVRRLRAHGEAGPLVLWAGMVVYLLIIEPPLYFPEVFGLEDTLGLIFVHNVFMVTTMWDRLPLYIVALYPALAVLVYEMVRMLGVFARRGTWIGALCVGAVYHAFYAVFDQIGPQLRWWIWNPDAPSNDPMVGSVPLTSAFGFAMVGPFALAVLVRLLVRSEAQDGHSVGWLAGRILLVGVGTPLAMAGLMTPVSVFSGDEHATTRGILMGALIVVVSLVAAYAMARSWQEGRREGVAAGSGQRRYVLGAAAAYLGVLAALWLYALPATLRAVDGVTADGTPAANLPYAAAAFTGALLVLVAAATVGRSDTGVARRSSRLSVPPRKVRR